MEPMLRGGIKCLLYLLDWCLQWGECGHWELVRDTCLYLAGEPRRHMMHLVGKPD